MRTSSDVFVLNLGLFGERYIYFEVPNHVRRALKTSISNTDLGRVRAQVPGRGGSMKHDHHTSLEKLKSYIWYSLLQAGVGSSSSPGVG